MEGLNICPKCLVVIGQYGQCNCNSRHRWIAGWLIALFVALLIVPGAMAVAPLLDNPSCTTQDGYEVCSEWQTVDRLTTIAYTVREIDPRNDISHFTVSAAACPVAASYTTQPPATTANPALDPTTGTTGFKWEDFDVNFGVEPVMLTVSSADVLPEPGTVAVKAGPGFTLFAAWVFGCTAPEPTATSTPTMTATNTPDAQPTATVTNTPEPEPTATATIQQPIVTVTHEPTTPPTPTVTGTRTPTATPTVTPTHTMTPTATQAPSSLPPDTEPIIGPGPCHSDTPWGCYPVRLWLPVIAG